MSKMALNMFCDETLHFWFTLGKLQIYLGEDPPGPAGSYPGTAVSQATPGGTLWTGLAGGAAGVCGWDTQALRSSLGNNLQVTKTDSYNNNNIICGGGGGIKFMSHC